MKLTTTYLEDSTRDQIDALAWKYKWSISQTVKYLVESVLLPADECEEVHRMARSER